MKTKTLAFLTMAALAASPAFGDQKVSARVALAAGSVAPATDILPIVDVSAGTSGSKKITINDLFTGWGVTSAGSTLAKAVDVPAQRTALGLVIGTNVQAWDTDLDTWATKTAPSGTVVGTSDTQTLTNKTLTSPTISNGTLTSPTITLASNATGDIYYRNSSGAFTRLAIGTTGQVLTVASGLPSWATGSGGGGGGLVNLTETLNTTSPNTTSFPTVGLTTSGTATDMNFALTTKGDGSILADIPDGNSAGGNARGARSVDLQIDRTTSADVASGNYAVVSGGSGNKATNTYSSVGGGASNTASGTHSHVGGGVSNNATGNWSVIAGGEAGLASGGNSTVCGGYSNTASGSLATVLGGSSNTASGDYSRAGGRYATTRGLYGMQASASGRFSVLGDAQTGTYLLRRQTTDATTTELSCDGSTPGSVNRVILPDNHAFAIRGRLVARNTSTGDMAVWEIKGAIKRGSGVATAALVGSPTVTMLFNDSGASAWTVAITADTTNGSLKVSVTGAAATTIRWLAEIETLEVN